MPRLSPLYPLVRRYRRLSTFADTTRKVACIGRNYVDHIRELNNPVPKEPFFFLKPPSCIIKQGTSVKIPRGIHANHEVELGLIIGSKIDDGTKFENSMISGYFLAIDMTARNLQEVNKKAGLPWTTAKGFDTFCPVSEVIPTSSIPNANDLTLELSVNGVVKQFDSTELMIYKIPRIIEHIASIMTLEEGDLVLTGTPKGVSRVVAGDTMRASISAGGSEITSMTFEVEDRKGGYSF